MTHLIITPCYTMLFGIVVADVYIQEVIMKLAIPYYKRLGIYKSSKGNNVFNPNTMQAHSYGHWMYVDKIEGKIVFNNYFYSQTTTQHQRNMLRLFSQLGIKVDVFVNMRESLSSFKSCALLSKYEELITLKLEIEKPKTHKKTNEKRKKRIVEIFNEIQVLQNLGAVIHRNEIQIIQNRIKSKMGSDQQQKLLKKFRLE